MDKLEESIHKFIDNRIKGVDIYINKGSIWMIFTNTKNWVFELEESGTLWYNYYFFDKIFNFFSQNVVEKQDYITRWVEDTLQNGVKRTAYGNRWSKYKVEDTLQNGVKRTSREYWRSGTIVEDTLKNGIKKTWYEDVMNPKIVVDALENGIKIVKDTVCLDSDLKGKITYIVENCKKENRQQIIVNSFED